MASELTAVADPATAAPADRPAGPVTAAPAGAVLKRVEHQIHWYNWHATTARLWYCTIKVAQITLAAFVPVAVGLDLPKLLTGSLGGLIVVLEGLQQLYRFHDNWVRYRSTCLSMEREKYLCAARAGDYAHADRPYAVLALRVENLTNREAAQWVSLQQADARPVADGRDPADEDAAGSGP